MTLEEARSRAKQLNAQHHLKQQEEQLRKIEQDQDDTQRRYDAVLPSEFAAEFEIRFVRKRDSQTEQGLRKNTRAYVTWRAAQRLIVAINTDPSEWFYHTDRVYDYFWQQKMSLRYLQGVLRMANLWGFFFCRKLARPFLPIPVPRGYERQRLIDANYEKRGVARASRPLSPADLQGGELKLNRKNFNWLFLSVWFGLRPKEVDSLHAKELWRVETLPSGRKILWVFQTKIIALPPEDRWKPIPILYDEQHFALQIAESGHFRRPLRKTLRKHFGCGVTLYAGRKGFTDLMLSKNQSLENISVWMGHSSLQRTWRSYKQRRKFHLAGY
ncbi:MAG: site-specific integrase [Deltaproteobacteria bacterium]|nr:site-specific integrase [Deltaproteobacteria bacterium]